MTDLNGLQLVVRPNGSKAWWYAYRFPASAQGKQKTLTIGPYPMITLKEARQKRDEARELIIRGIDPGEHKKEMKRISDKANSDSFAVLAWEWYLIAREKWSSEEHAKNVRQRLEKYLIGGSDNKNEEGDDLPFGKLRIDGNSVSIISVIIIDIYQ